MHTRHLTTTIRAAGGALAASLVALTLSAAPANAGIVHFCSQVLNPGSYCDSSSVSSPVTSIYATATAGGDIAAKVFFSGGGDTGYTQNSTPGVLTACVVPLGGGGFARVRNPGAAAHSYTATVYSWPDYAPGC
ncbi:hypothetical protein Q5424_02185 [Conexibacter sp. JD483]|uniref:hypothetical protein n=1 Tax=unclassified Conexibacter TaxID=2627773 RepID=UPI0027257482|nr:MULTISPECIES: hypothetical protein [unclassified Conexibacter]MDO8185608.1 hypothetical protein [Conexibacter sp. CPCC 205706]MDO8198781.1 hypothetical protein [Conexibacter sp. CPCC 205762]MDR9367869.1 hypothetical protein [Conexibacter sp. JD483]